MVGMINTLIGFSIVFGLMFLGLSPLVSNFFGYAVGAVVSFFLNRRYTFKESTHDSQQILKFFMVLLLSYGLNFLTLKWLLTWMDPYVAQLLSAVVYTLSSFLLVKFIVFKEPKC